MNRYRIKRECIMGVPITFIDRYCPSQFEILGMTENDCPLRTKTYTPQQNKDAYFIKFGKKGTCDLNRSSSLLKDGNLESVYIRLLIKHRR